MKIIFLLLYSLNVLNSLYAQEKNEKPNFSSQSDSQKESLINDEKKLIQSIGDDPENKSSYIRKLMKKAEEYYFQKKINVALRLFEIVIQNDPENALAYRYAGDILLIQNKHKEAIEKFEIARELSKEPEEEWFRLGQTYIFLKDYKNALLAIQQALTLKPEFYKCHFYLGLIYFNAFRNKKKTIDEWEIYKEYLQGAEKEAVKKAIINLRRNDFVYPQKTDSLISNPK